jgi:hypothetical protein
MHGKLVGRGEPTLTQVFQALSACKGTGDFLCLQQMRSVARSVRDVVKAEGHIFPAKSLR